MKTRMNSYSKLVMASFIALSVTLSTPAMANGGNDEKSVIELKFIGSTNSQSLFQLDLNNKEEDEFTITITDKSGNTLYAGRIKGVNISQKFRFDTEEVVDQPLRVKVKARKSDKTEIYEISRNTRVIEEASVSKL